MLKWNEVRQLICVVTYMVSGDCYIGETICWLRRKTHKNTTWLLVFRCFFLLRSVSVTLEAERNGQSTVASLFEGVFSQIFDSSSCVHSSNTKRITETESRNLYDIYAGVYGTPHLLGWVTHSKSDLCDSAHGVLDQGCYFIASAMEEILTSVSSCPANHLLIML